MLRVGLRQQNPRLKAFGADYLYGIYLLLTTVLQKMAEHK